MIESLEEGRRPAMTRIGIPRTKRMRDVEETSLTDRGNSLVCVPIQSVVTSPSGEMPARGAEASVSGGYYLLLPKRPPKSHVACEKMVTLCAFGPFFTSEAVSFIRTSAMSLGLL